MSIIIRLQNLPWSANAADIRRYFSGQSIPEGGVHIVGGEMGDAFIAFSTDEDARLAMAKDGGKIKDMQIKLLLSSRTEMMRVIEQARQQNMVVTQPPVVVSQPPIMTMPQPPRIVTSSTDSDRRRGRSPSPPHRRSRDRSPTRDRRRSPDDRRMSKRERSRSPRSNRNFNRDMDRRSDRFRRDDRHYDDSRYRDDRRPRESSVESKKYSDSGDHDSRSQFHAPEGFHKMQSTYDQTSNPSMAGFYAYGNPQSNTGKNFSETFIPAPPNPPAQTSQMERSAPQKLLDFPPISNQNQPPSSTYSHDQMQFRGTPFESSVPLTKTDPDPSVEQQLSKSRRRSRFEPEFVPPTSSSSRFPSTHVAKPSIENQPYSNVTHAPQNYSETRSSWPLEVTENDPWNEKRQGPISKNGDLVQVVPMDIDPLPAESTPEKETYETLPLRNSSPFLRGNASPRNEDLRKENQNRGHVQNNNPVLSMQDRVPMPQNESRVMPMRNDMSGRIPPSLTVEVRGLPPDARIDDILDLFQGIPLPAANIRIEANEQGFEKAYIRFVSAADFEEALNRNRRFMHERRCELVPCPAVAFDSAHTQSSQRSRPKLKPRDEDLTVQLRGLPFSCKDDDVVRFFDGLGILDLYVDIAPDGRASGSGFVEFGTQEDFRAALTMNGKLIGHRYITVSVASKEMMAFARGDDYNSNIQPTRQEPQHHSNQHFPNNRPPQFSTGPGQNQVRPNLNNQNRPSAPPVNQTRQGSPQTQSRPPPSISLKNLPEGVNNRDIADFLSQMNVVLRAIHIMLRPDKTPSGDAFAELAGPEDLEAALELNGSVMKGRRISVTPIPFHEMAEIVGRPGPPMPPPPAPGALLRTPGNIERPRRPLLPQGPPAEGTFRERPRLEPPSRGPRPRMDPFKGNMEPVRPYGSARARGPRPQRGSRSDSRFPPPAAERGIKDFGSPGCVVSIHNLHFQAGLEELLDFFRDYNLSKDNIIRKYNESGQTTGEARVAFQTPRDAQKAVRELNRKAIMGRPLSLMVL